jgi:hypothetical protein
MARYILRARGIAGPVEFQQRLTIDEALAEVQKLRNAQFTHFTIINVMTGVEIKDVDALIMGAERPESE